MQIDETHRTWAVWTAALLAAAAIAFILCWIFYRREPAGGTIPGIVFGFAGYGLMAYAFLLYARKKYPTQSRIWQKRSLRWLNKGAVQTWMRGHIWLGALSYAFILFHSRGLRFGNAFTVTWVLMWSFTFVVVTGLLVAVLQTVMPRFMTVSLPMESIYNDIRVVRKKLLREANELLRPFSEKGRRESVPVLARGATAVTVTTVVSEAEADKLWNTYQGKIKPYLKLRDAFRPELSSSRTAEDVFTRLREGMPERIRPVIDKLEEICREKRDLDRQVTLHWVLHGWLLVHIPLAALVIILGAVHAIMSIHYLS